MMRAVVVLPLALALAGQFRTSVVVVRVEALVLQDGRPVAGLDASHLVVTDNGQPQRITVQPLARLPIDVVIALDASESLRGPRLERLRDGALAMLAHLTPADRATLATFNDLVTLGPRDATPQALEGFVRSLRAQGGTALADAITAALVWSWDRERPTLLLAFSDGRDNASWTRADQALALAQRSDAVVDAVVAGELMPRSTSRIGVDGHLREPTPDERFLADLAALTGGRVHDGESGAGLAGAFRRALEQFRARYQITFTATSSTPGWHAIDVQVPGRRGVTVRARRGYMR
jgi:VWFA-related protein